MRLWEDSEEEIDVRWFRAPEGAEDVPHATAFGSLNWGEPSFGQGTGEVIGAPRPYDKGLNTEGYRGLDYCGSRRAWEGHARHGREPAHPTDDRGVAECCGDLFARQPVGLRLFPLALQSGVSEVYNPSIRTFGFGNATVGATHFNYLMPAVATAGETLVFITNQGGGSPTATTAAPPVTLQAAYLFGGAHRLKVWYIYGPTITLGTFSWPREGSNSAHVFWWILAGVTTKPPVSGGQSNPTGVSTLTAPSITLVNPSPVNMLYYTCNVAQSTGTPAGYTLAGALSPGPNYGRAFHKDPAAAGATGAQTVTKGTLAGGYGIQCGVY